MPSAPPIRSQSRAGAWLWLGCCQFFVAEQIARLGWAGHYSMARDYISDLGAVHCGAHPCSSLHWLMDGSFVLQGFLIFFGTLKVRGIFPGRKLDRIGLVLLAIAGIGVLVVGLAPEDVDFRFHILGAVANFLGGGLGMVLLGLEMMQRSACLGLAAKVKSWVTFVAGSVGLLATVALGFRGSPSWAVLGWPAGTVERLAAYPLPLWLMWMGFMLLRSSNLNQRSPSELS